MQNSAPRETRRHHLLTAPEHSIGVKKAVTGCMSTAVEMSENQKVSDCCHAFQRASGSNRIPLVEFLLSCTLANFGVLVRSPKSGRSVFEKKDLNLGR